MFKQEAAMISNISVAMALIGVDSPYRRRTSATLSGGFFVHAWFLLWGAMRGGRKPCRFPVSGLSTPHRRPTLFDSGAVAQTTQENRHA
jgi:hypothetical protein